MSGPGFIEFSYKTATEPGNDVFTFSMDGSGKTSASGSSDWQTFRQDVPIGTQTLAWTYRKDAVNNDPVDAVFIDQVVWIEDPSRDSDGDGISDVLENYFGTDPTRASRGVRMAGMDKLAGTVRFTHPINANPVGDIAVRYRWSSDLRSSKGHGDRKAAR